jgi:ribosome-associated protein
LPARNPTSEKKPSPKAAPKAAAKAAAKAAPKAAAKAAPKAAAKAAPKAAPKVAAPKVARTAQVLDKYRQDALAAATAAIDKQAIEPVLIDLSAAHSYTDYLLVTSGQGNRAVSAIAEHIQKVLAERGVRSIGSEGVNEGHWALLDFGDIVVHVFDHNRREFYDLEGLWFDAPRIELAIPPAQRLAAQTLRYDDFPAEASDHRPATPGTPTSYGSGAR